MKTETLSTPRIDTEAQDHAVETLYAVQHDGKELHPEPKHRASSSKESRHDPETPWQID